MYSFTFADDNQSPSYTLKLLYEEKVYVFMLDPSKTVGALKEEIKEKTKSKKCSILNTGFILIF